jgi:hypothetical protein
LFPLGEAFDILGEKSEAAYEKEVKDARSAIQALTDEGATRQEILRARLIEIDAEEALARARDKDTASLKKHISELEQQRKVITQQIPAMRQYGQVAAQVANAAGQAITSSAYAWGQGAITITQALRQIAAAVIQSIASIAEKKGVEQLAEGFGSWPDFSAMAHHFASAGLWFGLAGGISAAAGAVAGSGNNAPQGSAGNPNFNANQSPATQAQPTTVTQNNVQRFAAGGLVTGPTLALIGDSAHASSGREAAIPLDDPQAVSAIVEALGGSRGGDTHFHIQGLVSPDNSTRS